MNTTIGILAHVDAGKTTLSEQILYQTGVIRKTGRVDYKNTFLDTSRIEKERGITVFSDQAVFEHGGRTFQLIDTPGHVDFAGEMERSLSVLDCAVLVVSAADGVQSHTDTIFQLLKTRNIPTFVFLNKVDRADVIPEEVISEMEKSWQMPCIDLTAFFTDGEIGSVSAEQLAEQDDDLLEHYLNGTAVQQNYKDAVKQLVAHNAILPVIKGSALTGNGVSALLNALSDTAPFLSAQPEAPLKALAYKVRHDKQGGRIVFLKILRGTLRPKDNVTYCLQDGEVKNEKINELRVYNGSRYTLGEHAGPGALCAVTGLAGLPSGWALGESELKPPQKNTLLPLLSAAVLPEPSVNPKDLLLRLKELEDEEPLLQVKWNEESKEISVQIMGTVQLEILKELMLERFGYRIDFGPCEILYRETILEPVVGYGHFEPLRHYAEVHVRLDPMPRGSGITFESECPTDALSQNWQNLVRTHVFEKEHRGVLTGAPLTDVRIVLLAGRAHLKHTEGGDFREATYRAIRQGLMHAQNELLEPWYRFSIQAEIALTGRILSDIQKRNGSYEPPENTGELVRINGRAPAVCMMDYPKELTVFTHGKGRISMQFDGYEPCHNRDEIIESKHYEPERDLANTPDSVFCSHGAGFPVKWNQMEQYIHIK